MAAGSVPTANLAALYLNTTAGTPASPTVMDAAIGDIVQTINDNYDYTAGLVSTGKLSSLGIISLVDYQSYVSGDDWSPALTQAVQAAESSVVANPHDISSSTNAKEILVPSGIFKLYSTVDIPYYVSLVGMGRAETQFQGEMTDGSPMLRIGTSSPDRGYYNVIQGMTLNGFDNNCIGLRIEGSRWILRDVVIQKCSNVGLSLYEAYIGEMYSVLLNYCGTATLPAMLFDGSDAGHGCHNVKMFGGEIAASVSRGADLKYGNAICFYGVDIADQEVGLNFTSDSNLTKTVVSGCYFEANTVADIQGLKMSYGVIENNFFTDVNKGASGSYLAFNDLIGCSIRGNVFGNANSPQLNKYDATAIANFEGNYIMNNDNSDHSFTIHDDFITFMETNLARYNTNHVEFSTDGKMSVYSSLIYPNYIYFKDRLHFTSSDTDVENYRTIEVDATGTIIAKTRTSGNSPVQTVALAGVANNLTTTAANLALDARQGKTLNDKLNKFTFHSTLDINFSTTGINTAALSANSMYLMVITRPSNTSSNLNSGMFLLTTTQDNSVLYALPILTPTGFSSITLNGDKTITLTLTGSGYANCILYKLY